MTVVVGISLVRNADDIIGPVVRHMLGQVDAVLIADNLSTDGTRDILDALPCDVVDDPDPAHYQGRKMTALARKARDYYGAEWIIPFDADEWWYSPFGTIRDVVCESADCSMLTAALYDHVTTDADPDEPDPTRRIGWRRREPGTLPKVAAAAFSQLRIHEGNHGADFGPFEPKVVDGRLIVRHFPYRSEAQFIGKARMGAAALAATDLPEDVGRHWRDYGRLTDDQLAETYREHFHAADPTTRRDLIFDPAP